MNAMNSIVDRAKRDGGGDRGVWRNAKRAMPLLIFAATLISSHAAQGQAEHKRESAGAHNPKAEAMSAKALPPLKMVLPQAGDVIGTQVAVVFETPADLARMTMVPGMTGVHLHVEMDNVTAMPAVKDLISMGRHRYLYVFDLPVAPGPHLLRVYWAGSQHETVESSVQKIAVKVEAQRVK